MENEKKGLKRLEDFLTKPDSEVSKNYIADLLSGKLARPEESFVHSILNQSFWEDMGFSINETHFEKPAGTGGRVEWSLEIEGKKIAVECKKPYIIKNEKETINNIDGTDIKELKDQLGDYLVTHDFIIYTNGFHWYFYSRESYRSWVLFKNKKDSKVLPYFKYLTSEEIFKKNSIYYIENILSRNNILEELKSLENKSIRHLLTEEFFSDLSSWVGYIDQVLRKVSHENKARTTSLVNKIMFVRTMESVGIIPNGYLTNMWNQKKGISKSTVKLIDNIDDEFSEIYNTELFTAQYLENEEGETILKDGMPQFNPERAKNFAYSSIPEEFFSALFRDYDEASINDTGKTKLEVDGKTFYIRTIYWWKFEAISADILGKAYETYLAKQRKKLGIYYTPSQMSEFIAKSAISKIFDVNIQKLNIEIKRENLNTEKIKSITNKIVDIKICDPTCGSGSFLIQAIREVWRKYKEIEKLIQTKEKELTNETKSLDDFSNEEYGVIRSLQNIFRVNDKQNRMGTLILRHIYGNDKDEKAVDTAKLNIWLECLRLESNAYRKKSLVGKRHVLPNLSLNITQGDSFIGVDTETMDKTASALKDTIKTIYKLREEYITNFDRTMLATYAAQMRAGLEGLANDDIVEGMGLEKAEKLLKIAEPTNWSIQHITAFYDKEGNLKPKEEQGFDVIIGNPPWEVLKPNIDEFFAPFFEAKYVGKKFSTLKKIEKDQYIKELTINSNVKPVWDKYVEDISILSEYFNKSRFFRYQKDVSNKGFSELNLYRLFLEKAQNLLKKDGICGVVIPSNLYSDFNTKRLRELLFKENKIISIFSFDNKNKIFEDVHGQWKFMIFMFQKSNPGKSFQASFFLRELEILNNIDKNSINYDYALIEKTSPTTSSIVECSNQIEIEIINKLYQHPLLITDKEWNLQFIQGDFNISSDVKLFNSEKKGAVIYEGKMIHQFKHDFAEPRYWIENKTAQEKLIKSEERKITSQIKKQTSSKKIKNSEIPTLQLSNMYYRLVWRNVSMATNTRTMISTILPPDCFFAHSFYFIKPIFFNGSKYQPSMSLKETVYLCAMFNSFVIDYILRHRVSINISSFFVHEIPIPRLKESDEEFNKIVNLAGSLICTSEKFDRLKNELGINEGTSDINEREDKMVKINALVGKVFSLSKEEFEYILNSFTSVNDDFKDKTLKEFLAIIN